MCILRPTLPNLAWFLGVLALGGFPASAVRAADCAPATGEKIRTWSLAMDPQVETLGNRYLADCPERRDEALLWLTYYYRARGDYAQAAALSQRLALSDSASERDRLLNEAMRGESAPLEARIRAHDPAYAGDAEALLVLARALARDKRFADARIYYTDYLQKKPDDRDIDIERSYTYLWEGDGPRSAESFRKVRSSSDLNAGQIAVIDSGIAASKGVEPEMDRPHPAVPPYGSFGADITDTNFHAFSKTATSLNFQGANLGATARSVWLNSDLDGSTSYGAVAGSGRAAVLLDNKLRLAGSVGGFSTGDSLVLYEAMVEYTTDDGIQPYLGAYQSALAEDVPLPRELSVTARTGQLVGFRYKQYADARFENRGFDGLTTSHYLMAKLQAPIRQIEGVGAARGGVRIFFLGENEAFSQANQYVYSPQSTTALRLGAEYDVDVTESVSGRASASYGTVLEQPATGSALSFGTSASLIGAEAAMGYKMGRAFLADFRFRLDRTSGAQGTTYAATSFGVGVTYQIGTAKP